MTLGELRAKVTDEELALWSAYYAMLNKERAEAQRRSMSRRRKSLPGFYNLPSEIEVANE